MSLLTCYGGGAAVGGGGSRVVVVGGVAAVDVSGFVICLILENLCANGVNNLQLTFTCRVYETSVD